MSFYYDWTVIDGYNCRTKIVISERGLGKTFGKVRMAVERVAVKIFKGIKSRFIYVVETGEMVKELCRNNGEKFWAALLEYYEQCDTSRKRYFYNLLTKLEVIEDDEEDENISDDIIKKSRTINAKLRGGTILINGETAGYILDMNAFGELKRNNFPGVDYVIIDEFITEKMDKTTLENPKKISSVIQSILRLRKDAVIYMLGNAIRLDDPILSRMGFKLEKYGIYKRYNKKGKLIAVLDFVNPEDYPEFKAAHDDSVAGEFSELMGETQLENNTFKTDIPNSRRLGLPIKYKKGGLTLNVVKDDVIVTLKQLTDGNIACVPFANTSAKMLYCMTEKEQGYRLGYRIICNKALRQVIMNMLRADIIYYYSDVEYNKLKIIVKGT